MLSDSTHLNSIESYNLLVITSGFARGLEDYYDYLAYIGRFPPLLTFERTEISTSDKNQIKWHNFYYFLQRNDMCHSAHPIEGVVGRKFSNGMRCLMIAARIKGIVCTFYSTIGGMKAVLITDVFQSILMFAAVFSVIIYAWIDKGSLAEIWRIAAAGNRTDLLNFDPDPTVRHTWFTLVIGGGVTFLTLYGVNQTQVQRYLTVKDLRKAQLALWWNWPILTALSLSTSFSGLAIYSRYFNCDPVLSKQINTADQLMPYYVVDTMGNIPGLSGLFVAGIFSAGLSTISAALNSLAAITIEDYIKPIYFVTTKKKLTESSAAVQTKLISLIFGGVCIAVAFLAQFLGGLLQASLTIFGVIGGPLLGLFSLGMFTTVANEAGSVTGLVCGIGFAMWMAFGSKPPVPLPKSTAGCDQFNIMVNATTPVLSSQPERTYLWIHRVSYLYNGVFGLLITLFVGVVVSYLINKWSKKQIRTYDPNLFIPPLERRLRRKYGESLHLGTIVPALSLENLKT